MDSGPSASSGGGGGGGGQGQAPPPASPPDHGLSPKDNYRVLKKKFKFLVYVLSFCPSLFFEQRRMCPLIRLIINLSHQGQPQVPFEENECYQEELRNLQRKLLKLSRDKKWLPPPPLLGRGKWEMDGLASFLLDRLMNFEKPGESSDDSDSSIQTRTEEPKKAKKFPPPFPFPPSHPLSPGRTAGRGSASGRPQRPRPTSRRRRGPPSSSSVLPSTHSPSPSPDTCMAGIFCPKSNSTPTLPHSAAQILKPPLGISHLRLSLIFGRFKLIVIFRGFYNFGLSPIKHHLSCQYCWILDPSGLFCLRLQSL